MNVLGHDVQTASQSGVRTPRCDTCRVAAVRGDWAFGTGLHSVTPRPSTSGTGCRLHRRVACALHAVTLAALRQYAVTGRSVLGSTL